MPDHTKLKVGDKIRLLSVPEGDLRQREQEIKDGLEDAGWTADTIERIIRQDPIVIIAWLDEYGLAWFEYDLIREDGSVEEHALAMVDDESWEYVQD